MIFRPKIFISSTFKENEEIREQIRDYFYSVGAEPLLYERELTPSINPMTYRINLLDADFMILIVKDEYGTETETGISGMHEEYKIAHNNKIPLHVYLKKNNTVTSDTTTNPLIEDLKKDGISYYYFNNDLDLLKRLKETTFTIAKEIMINDITKSKVPKESIIKLAGNSDYDRAMQVISIIESMKNVITTNELDWVYSSLFVACLECIDYEFSSTYHHFINWKLDEKLEKMLKIARDFMEHSGRDFTSTSNWREYNIKILGKTRSCNLSYNKSTDWNIIDYSENLKYFFEAYDEFKELTQNIRTEIDLAD